jgi:hyaluronoglucosaminidase
MFGVIEGFYGDPWSHAERLACIDAMAGWGANAYVWAPKSEPRHRNAWADEFTAQEVEQHPTAVRRVDTGDCQLWAWN